MNQTQMPVYINSIYIKQNPKFEGLNLSIKVGEFVKFLQEHKNDKGFMETE